jgi:5'(3')-deoxyribonucleotidase
MTKKTLYIDMDGVIVDFKSAIPKVDPLLLEKYKTDHDEIPGIFSLMEPMPGAIEAVEFLFKHFDAYILSTAPWENPSAWSDKLKWVKKYLPNVGRKRLILSHNKHTNKGEYLIDDRTANGTDKFTGEHIHFGKGRFKSWAEVLRYLCNNESLKIPKHLKENMSERELKRFFKERNDKLRKPFYSSDYGLYIHQKETPRKESKPFIIPQEKTSFIAKVVEGKINIIKTIDIPYQSINKFTENNLIASQCTATNEFRVYNSEAELLISKPDCKYRAMEIKQNTVYLGGEYTLAGENKKEGEMFSIINLENPENEIENISLPIKVIPGKSIDDILIRDNQLILVDNMMLPKYLFEYDISDPGNPKYVKTKQLNYNGPYEHILKGDINKNWMAILSFTFGRGGQARHLSISGKTERYMSISAPPAEKLNELPDFIKDFCLVDDFLVICKNNGVQIIDLDRWSCKRSIRKADTKIPTFDKLIKTTDNDLIGVNKNDYELINIC